MKTICLLFITCLPLLLFAQTNGKIAPSLIQEILEKYLEVEEENLDYTELEEQLEYLMKHKVKINSAKHSELSKLFFLNEGDKQAIFKHVKKHGELVSLFELQAVEGLSDDAIKWLPYFVTVDEHIEKQITWRDLKHAKNELFYLTETDIETRRGYTPQATTPYLGNAFRHVVRLRSNVNHRLYYGYTAEKDMGEPFNKHGISGFEFNSFHLFYNLNRTIKTIAVGDFQAGFGQGLILGSGFAPRKSALVMQTARNPNFLRPYRGLNQTNFLRGAAVELQLKNWLITPFISYKSISTTLQDDSLNTGFSSEIRSGLFRTTTEISRRNNNLQFIGGTHVSYKLKNMQWGVTYMHTAYKFPALAHNRIYRKFHFTGSNNNNIGINMQGYFNNVSYFTELAYSSFLNSWAGVAGAIISLHKNLDVHVLYRNYSKSFFSPLTNAFGAFQGSRNENGLYTAVALRINKSILLNTYIDWYESKWPRFNINSPMRGIDFLADLQFQPNRNRLFYIRYRNDERMQNIYTQDFDFDMNVINRSTMRFHAEEQISKQVTIRTRFEKSIFNSATTAQQGYMFFADINYKSQKRWQLAQRLTWFETDGFHSRIYAVEHDVLYQYSIPFFQHHGWRYYAVLEMQPQKNITCWIKYGHTQFSNQKTISGGNELINGNRLRDIRIQIRFNF